MGRELAAASAAARAVFQEVDDTLGQALFRLMTDGPGGRTDADRQRPARDHGQCDCNAACPDGGGWVPAGQKKPRLSRGHSLGEYSALCAAESFDLPTTALLLRTRGDAMQAAVPVGTGAMAVLLGLDFDAASRVAADAAQGEVCQAANDNGGGQVVISGHAAAVERAMELAKERGAKRALPLSVSAPSLPR